MIISNKLSLKGLIRTGKSNISKRNSEESILQTVFSTSVEAFADPT